jgi:hypothetical protein
LISLNAEAPLPCKIAGADALRREEAMLTLKDVIGLCELTEEEVRAIAEHEHLPDIVAAELANYLVHCEDGIPRISRMIVDDIAVAERRGDAGRALALKATLKHFVASHPYAKTYAR